MFIRVIDPRVSSGRWYERVPLPVWLAHRVADRLGLDYATHRWGMDMCRRCDRLMNR